jgi:hypothetical protein
MKEFQKLPIMKKVTKAIKDYKIPAKDSEFKMPSQPASDSVKTPSAPSATSAPNYPSLTPITVAGVPPLSSYTPPSQTPSTEKYVDEKTVKEIHQNLTAEQEFPDGQYPLDEQRPVASSTLREFEYSPQEDTGTNEFYQVGASIDEKGVLPASIKPWLA